MIGNASKLMNHPDRLQAFWNGDIVVPITLEVQPSNKCNQNCKYCTIRHDNTIMTEDMLFSVLDQAKTLDIKGISVSGGGEPLLGHIEVFQHSAIPCGLITNGAVKVSPDIFGYFQWVRFSIDSINPTIYKNIRGISLPDCLIENIQRSVKQTYTGIQAVLIKENYSDLINLASWARDFGIDYLQIRPDENRNEVWMDDWNAFKALETNKFKILIRQDKVGYRKDFKCFFGNFHMTITADGSCWVCSCGKPRHKVGDLYESSLYDVIYSKKRQRVIQNINAFHCPPGCKGASINATLTTCLKHKEWL